jgi:hypothetical protein
MNETTGSVTVESLDEIDLRTVTGKASLQGRDDFQHLTISTSAGQVEALVYAPKWDSFVAASGWSNHDAVKVVETVNPGAGYGQLFVDTVEVA